MKARSLYNTRRLTGWQIVFGLRTDRFPNGYEFQYELGCLDALTSMPAGSVAGVTDTQHPPVRWVRETNFLRAGA